MPLTFACPGCARPYSVPDDLAGRRVRCKACRAVMEVPAADAIDLGIVTDPPDRRAEPAKAKAPAGRGRPDGWFVGLAGSVIAAALWGLIDRVDWHAITRTRAQADAEARSERQAGRLRAGAEEAARVAAHPGRVLTLGGRPVLLARQSSAFGIDGDVPEPDMEKSPPVGSDVVLADDFDGEDPERDVVLCRTLADLDWNHGGRHAEDLPELQRRVAIGGLFGVPRGSIARVVRVIEGRLPLGMRAVEVSLGPGGRTAWVADTFAR